MSHRERGKKSSRSRDRIDKASNRRLTAAPQLPVESVGFFHRSLHYGINPILAMAMLAMLLFSLNRLVLSLCHYEELPQGLLSSESLYNIFLQGIRVDFASICGLFAPPLLLLLFCSLIPRALFSVPRIVILLIKIYVAAAMAFLVMNEEATFGFIREYGVRPNYIYVQYLIYPKEVFSTLWSGHKVGLLLNLLITVSAFYCGYLLVSRLFKGYRQAGVISSLCMLLLVVCIVPLGIRSTLGHRPLNPAMVAFSDSALVNSLPLNSSFSAVYAALHLNDVKVSTDNVYKIVDAPTVLSSLDRLSVRQLDSLASRESHKSQDVRDSSVAQHCPLNQFVEPYRGVFAGINAGTDLRYVPKAAKAGAEQTDVAQADVAQTDTVQADNAQTDAAQLPPTHEPYNVVIILEESLGDNFVASQGGLPVTPYLEELREQGWWFENMYAAGQRSVRGIEAVTASMPPSVLNSIVKLPHVGTYSTIFNIFREAGYATSFIYGGESHFDNMRNYFYENGMEEVIERKDYKHPSFVASWGVSDEDLFARANEKFKEYHAKKQKFMSVIFSSSFHDPFDIPEGKVSLDGLQTEEPQRLLAAKYADYALGNYLKQAQQQDYYKDTVFLIIADHESQVRGTGPFPLYDYSIPAVILAPNVKAHTDYRQVSQIDMGVTLMSLAGISGSVPNVGQDLTRADAHERAIMQYNDLFAYLKGERLVVLAPNSQPFVYKVAAGDKTTLIATGATGDAKVGAIDDADAVAASDADAMSAADADMVRDAVMFNNLGIVIYQQQLNQAACIKLKTKLGAPKL